MKTSTVNMRRTYYIKKDFQKRFMVEYAILIVIGAILANWMLYDLLDKGVDDAFYRAHIKITTTGDVVRSPLALTSMAVISISAAAVLAFTILNSWRVGNCLNSLAGGVEGLRNGDLTVEVKVCRGDHFIELADIFNTTVGRLNKKITLIKEDVMKIDEESISIDTDRANAIERLLKKIESAEGHLSTFKLHQ